ncbi:DNA cytosine methyltransferase [Nannocystis pusilla]|uniref:DNA cytosine methyltransferase n=1 Tax=Nannocystis pusilla TaxID=889268 RepID=UPI003B7B43DA
MFSGSGGCSLGFKEEGFETLACIDSDEDACADLDYLLEGNFAVCANIARMTSAELRRIVGDRRPDVLVSTPPCKAWSKCLPKKQRFSPRYQEMAGLARRAIQLALGAWAEPPPLILIENVRGMNTEGAHLMKQIQADLRRHGYVWNIRVHNVGQLGGLAQNRDRCLFVARREVEIPCFLMLPTLQPVRPCGDELGKLSPPILAPTSGSMHRLPEMSMRNWVRLAAIPKGRDWKALPTRIRLGGAGLARHNGKYGVEDPARPAHTVVGKNRVVAGWSAVADQRAFEFVAPSRTDKPASSAPSVDTAYRLGPNAHNGIFGVEDPDRPAHTITGNARVQGSWGAFSDVRVSDHGGQRKNGGFGVNDPSAPAHAVLAEGSVQNTWAAVADDRATTWRGAAWTRAWTGRRGDRGVVDPRLTCSQWNGAYGVLDPNLPSPTVLAHTRHDNAPGSYADPRLEHAPWNDSFGVIDPEKPSPAIRAHHEVRQAPGAVADPCIDPRKAWPTNGSYKDRPQAYGVQDWDKPSSTIKGKHLICNSRAAVAHPSYPVPTHHLVVEDGELVLYGPEIKDWDEIGYLVIATEIDEPGSGRWSWHRPLTDLELAVLQSLPAIHRGEMLALRGPSGARREHIGNMLPRLAARAMARECRATLDEAGAGGQFHLVGGGTIWVREEVVR